MNVAKNWALTIILIALTLKEQMIIPVEKTLNNAGHIDAKIESILAKFPQKIQRNRLFFTDCFSAKFPPEISREIGRFFGGF